MQGLARCLSLQASEMMKAQVLSGKHLRTQHYATQWYGKDIVEVVIQDDTALTKNQELVARLKEKLWSVSSRLWHPGETFDCLPIVGTTSTGPCLNVNATVGDALEMVIPGGLTKGDPVIVTANVYFPVAKFLHVCPRDEGQIFMDLVYQPKYKSHAYTTDFEVITLRPDAKLWQARQLVNVRRGEIEVFRFSLSELGRSGKYLRNSEIIWSVNDNGTLMLSPHHRRIEQKRLWLQLRH